MKKLTFILSAGLFLSVTAKAQDMGFENPSAVNGLPQGLFANGPDMEFKLDATTKHSGKYSLMVSSKPDAPENAFASVGYKVPASLKGKTLSLTGWIRSSELTNRGRAGLWLRIDGEKRPLDIDNMMTHPVSTDIDWTRFEVSVAFSPETKTIVFGGLLIGRGKIWLDDLELTASDKPTTSSGLLSVKPSGVAQMTLTPERSQNLFVLARVWGLLKYFHPAVALGKYNWDEELFKELNKTGLGHTGFDAEMVHWITSLGDLPACGSCAPAVNDSLLKINAWINDKKNYSPELTAALRKVIINRNTGINKYVSLSPGVNNPDFKDENPYAMLKDVDTGYRMLALFRFWNMVEYFYPYKNLIGEDWNTVLVRSIPDLVNAHNSLEYKLAIWKMISSIHDTHANLYTVSSDQEMLEYMGGSKTLPVKLKYVQNKWVVEKVFAEAPETYSLKIGDVITAIDGKPIQSRVNFLMPYACASNITTAYRNISTNLFWTNADMLKLNISRNGQVTEIEAHSVDKAALVKAAQIRMKIAEAKPAYKLLDPQVGYLTMDKVKSSFFKQMFAEFKDTKGIVIDMRNYPSEFVVFTLNEYLRDKPAAFVKFTNTRVSAPGLYNYTPMIEAGKKRTDNYKGKLVILVNEDSQSQAEYTTMALRAGGRAIVMGSQTAGADGNVSQIALPGGLSTFFSGIGVFYPDGKGTQRIGIVPDIEVKPTIKGIAAGRDGVLEKAVEWIKKDQHETF